MDEQSARTYEKRKNGLDYYSLDATSQDQSVNRTELNGRDVLIKSGGDTTLSAVTVNADSLAIDAGGKLALLAPKTQDSEGWNVTHGSSGSVGAKGRGGSDEELNYTQFNVTGPTSIKAQGGIQAQVGQDVSLQDLAKQPGMGWVSQITGDPELANSTEWQRVQQAHEQWAYQQSGMGPVSAALVAIGNAMASNAAANNYLNHKQWAEFAEEMNQCSAKASGCSDAEQRTIRDRYQQISAEQNAALANCDKTGTCDELRSDVASGTDAMLNLAGQLPIGGAPGNDLGQFAGQQLANDPAYRAQVNASIEVVNHCNANPTACDEQALKAASLVLAPLMAVAGVPLTGSTLLIGGSLGAAANVGGQLYANGGKISAVNPNDAVIGGFTGALTYGAGFVPSMFINIGGAVMASGVNGADSNTAQGSVLGAAAGTMVGYPLGLGVERWLNGSMNHWSRPTWQDLGFTIQKWIEPSPIPGVAGSSVGGFLQEGHECICQ